ncbi:Anion exchange protein 3 [Desmophyllum pertusum]|uniref:Anion exchange protein 3 n=1 Tax=Desmophyllum pertusum TaxID=174260 RepID=A0A9W9ZH74_9CNID|nr:Anion exchange protein 3 [Desmophyllum pertusum]
MTYLYTNCVQDPFFSISIHDIAYRADSREDLLTAINGFLDDTVVLPPGEWDRNVLLPILIEQSQSYGTEKKDGQELFCNAYMVEFLPWRCWIGFWVMLILFGVVFKKNPLEKIYLGSADSSDFEVKGQPNTALLSTILVLGTFLVAFYLRKFRTKVTFLERRPGGL